MTAESLAVRTLVAALAVTAALAAPSAPAQAPAACDTWHASFESIEGAVELRRGSREGWLPAGKDTAICAGDAVRTGASGRAAIRLPDATLLRIDSHTSLSFAAGATQGGTLLDLLRGIIHVISRDPRSLRFDTPYANAGIEGTEFSISADDEATQITVVEGIVAVSDAAADLRVGAGESARAGTGAPLAAARVADPFEASRWAAHFPQVVSPPLPDPDTALAAPDSPAPWIRRAAARAAVGRFGAARADLATALAMAPESPDALALSAMLALAAGDRPTATVTAERASERDPQSAPALIALSYARSSAFDRDGAVAAATAAVSTAPGNALAAARLAEASYAAGRPRDALAAADAAAAADPTLARVPLLRGFALLALGDHAAALDEFTTAARLDPADPLAALGRGLALIRAGRADAGRAALELAVALDPTNAAVRHQMAKIYSTEQRDSLAGTQLEIARRLDPGDPTTDLYAALMQQQANALVPALRSLQDSGGRTTGKAPFRSTLRLDDDLAVRAAGRGQLYRDLGFNRLALLDAWHASAADGRDFAPPRLLADVYSTLPNHQIARVNELFQSQLLQPLNVAPVPPQFAEANRFILNAAGPSELAFNEFGPLVSRDGVRIQGSAVIAGNGTDGADFEIAGLNGAWSYSVGGFAFESDGFRPNNDIDQRVANALLQYRAGHGTSLFGELRSATTDKGDLSLLFDPDNYLPNLRQHEAVDSLRLGLRHDVAGKGTLLAAAIRDEIDIGASIGSGFESSSRGHSHTVDFAYIHDADRWQLRTGTRLFDRSIPTQFASSNGSGDAKHRTLYAYADYRAGPTLTLSVGLGADSIRSNGRDDRELSPKLGLLWQPDDRTTVRAAAFRTLQGPLISKEIIQPGLEPTRVSGFNQLFFGSEGERADRIGIGFDRRIGADMHAGFELSARDTVTPLTTTLPGIPEFVEHADGSEDRLSAYFYWTPTDHVSVSASYERVAASVDGPLFGSSHADVDSERIPLTLNWFPTARIQTRVRASLVEQDGLFAAGPRRPFLPPQRGSDRFTIIDLALSYRLPGRLGRVSLEANNLFDERFRFQDLDPENTRYFPERLWSLRLTLSY